MTTTEATPQERDAIIRALAVLSEHFECAQVMVSNHDPVTNKTTALSGGVGNVFARIGHVEDWLNDQQCPPPPLADGDEWKDN